MSPTRSTTTDRLNEHEQRLDGQDKAILVIQEQFSAFQNLIKEQLKATREQLDTMNKVVDSLKDTKGDVIRLQEKSAFDEWKRAFIVGFIMLGAGSGLGLASGLLIQFFQHLPR